MAYQFQIRSREYIFDNNGNIVTWQLSDDNELVHRRAQRLYIMQSSYLEYVAICRTLEYPILWESPLAVAEREELRIKNNGGRKPHATKLEMAARKINRKRSK